MGEKIAYLGVDKSVPLEVLLRAATAAGDSLGEETPSELYAWVQPMATAQRLRWFGLQAKLRSSLYPPSTNIAQSVSGIVDSLVFVRRESIVGTEQFEWFACPPGKGRLSRVLCVVGSEGSVRAVAGTLRGAKGEDDDAIELALAQTFPGEGDAYWNAYDDCEVYQLMRDGRPCPPTRVDEAAMSGCRNFLPHSADEDDLERAFPDYDDAPPPESGPARAPGIPTTWPELIERVTSRMPSMEAKLDGSSLTEAADMIAARAIAMGPSSIVPWVGTMWPQLAKAVAATRDSFEPSDALGIFHCVTVSRSCGAQVDPGVENYAKHLVELVADRSASLSERGRRKIAIAALGAGAFESVGKSLGVALEARVEPGKTHSFGIESSLAYLAAGLRAKQPARELEPAFREIVSTFGHRLHLEHLDWADLFSIARAFYVHAAELPPGKVGERLSSEVRGSTPRVTWAELGPVLRESGAESLETLRVLGERAKAIPPNVRAGELLVEVAECFAKLATLDPELALTQYGKFPGAMRRAMGEIPEKESLATSRAVFGVFSFLVASTACGAPSPEVTNIERGWLGDLAKTHMAEKLPNDLHRSLVFASLGAGVPGLVPIVLQRPKSTAARGSAPPDDLFGIALHLAQALEEQWPVEAAVPAFVGFYQRFPDANARGEASLFDLLSVVRAHHVQLRKQPNRGFGRFVRELVTALSPPPPPKPVVVAMPPKPTTPRPVRGVPLPHAAWSKIELRSVEGMWGGFVVTLYGDGDFWFEVVDRTTSAQLHRAHLQPQGLADFSAMLARHDPRAMQIPMRAGIPGETCPTITITGPGFTHRVSKWARDKHPDFDALGGWLYAMGAELAKSTAPIWTGPYDGWWTPG